MDHDFHRRLPLAWEVSSKISRNFQKRQSMTRDLSKMVISRETITALPTKVSLGRMLGIIKEKKPDVKSKLRQLSLNGSFTSEATDTLFNLAVQRGLDIKTLKVTKAVATAAFGGIQKLVLSDSRQELTDLPGVTWINNLDERTLRVRIQKSTPTLFVANLSIRRRKSLGLFPTASALSSSLAPPHYLMHSGFARWKEEIQVNITTVCRKRFSSYNIVLAHWSNLSITLEEGSGRQHITTFQSIGEQRSLADFASAEVSEQGAKQENRQYGLSVVSRYEGQSLPSDASCNHVVGGHLSKDRARGKVDTEIIRPKGYRLTGLRLDEVQNDKNTCPSDADCPRLDDLARPSPGDPQIKVAGTNEVGSSSVTIESQDNIPMHQRQSRPLKRAGDDSASGITKRLCLDFPRRLCQRWFGEGWI